MSKKVTDPINSGNVDEKISEALILLLFVHLAFESDAEKGLSATGLSRTHHRILFLIAQKPGVTVGEIVSLLRVSTQAIQAPLRTLIDNNLIQQQSSERDRRKRHLILTDQGNTFLKTLSNAQYSRIQKALDQEGRGRFEGFLSIMRDMMDESDSDWLYPSDHALASMVNQAIK